MRASSNNHYQKSLPFTGIQIHENKSSEDDTGYHSLSKQDKFPQFPPISSSSSLASNNQYKRIIDLVKSIPSPTDVSTIHNTSDIALTVAQRVAEYAKKTETLPIRKYPRTRIQPIPDSTSDSAESFALSNHLILVSSYPQQEISSFNRRLEYIHDNRFDSTTTVDHIKDDIITVELKDQQSNKISTYISQKIKNFGELIRSLPANVLAIVFISLIGGLILSAILIIIIL